MVQFKPTRRRASRQGDEKPQEWNTYWMLDSGSLASMKKYLRAKCFAFRSSIKVDRTKKLMERCQRGLISYNSNKLPDLEAMARSHGLQVPELKESNQHKSARLIALLEKNDEQLTFDLFRLPPELRTAIYEIYLNSLPILDLRSHQPPICLASKQLRHETLPLFYSHCTFAIELSSRRINGRIPRITVSSRAAQAMLCMGLENMSRLRRFDLSLYHRPFATWLVDFDDKADPVAMAVNEDQMATRWKRHCDVLTAELKAEVAEFQKKARETQPRRFDPQALVSACQRSYLK